MGFSLYLFIENLKEILALDVPQHEKNTLLEHALQKGEEYAIECGAIDAKQPAPVKFMPELYNLDDFLIFDTETTGFESNAEICQLGLINSKQQSLLNRTVKITIDMPKAAYKIHGITTEECKNFGANWEKLFNDFCEHTKGKHLVAWNLGYDLRLLKQTCAIHNISFDAFQPAGVHCAMKAYAQYHEIERGREKLITAAQNLGVDLDGIHDAIVDCEMVLGVMKKTWEK